ncbi:MAG: FtsX-like permease family protein [Aestuariibacter sp.]
MLTKIILASYQQHWVKMLFLLLALIAGVTGLSSVLIINETAKQSYQDSQSPLFAALQFRISAKTGAQLSKSDYAQGRRAGLDWVAVQNLNVTLSSKHKVAILALDFVSLPGASEPTQISTDMAAMNQGNLIVSPALAHNLGVADGEKLSLFSGAPLGKLVIDTSITREDLIVMDIGDLKSRYASGHPDEFWLFDSLTQEQLRTLQDKYDVEPVYYEDPATLTDSFHLNLLAMALLMMIVCLFIVMNGFQLVLAERKKNLVILRQLGVGRITLFGALLLELFMLSLVCSLLGTGLGMYLAKWLSPTVELTLTALYELDISFGATNLMVIFILAFGASFVGALLAALNPLLSLHSELSNVRAQQHSEGFTAGIWLCISLVLIVAYFTLISSSSGLIWYFLAVACVVLAGCSMLIVILPWVIKILAQNIPKPYALLNLATADSVRITQRSKVAMTAFFIAVTANIGMNLMVDSFRSATLDWLETRLVADYYMATTQPQAITQYLRQHHPEIWLWQRKRVKASFNGASVDVIGYPETLQYRDALRLKSALDSPWDVFLNDGVFINEQLAYQHNLKLKDPIELYVEDKILKRVVAGIHYDYGNMDKQVLLPSQLLSSHQGQRHLFAIHVSDDMNLPIEQLKAELKDIDERSNVSSLEQILAISMQTFDRTFIVTGALNIITLMVAAMSLATSIIIIELQNSPHSALIRSLGVGRWKLLGLSMLQYGTLALLTCVLAIPFGVLLSDILINKINVASFYWSYPLRFDFQIVLQVLLISIVIVLLSVFLPLWRNSRKSIVQRMTQ